MSNKIKIVFMGTPEFAVTILDKLVADNNINVVGCITAPDKKSGRGQKINQSDVKKYAVEKNLNILQPTNLKDEGFVSELRALEADLFVVVAFRMLPEVVWNMPAKGTINLHGSLLPQYRGAAPINWAVINGEAKTGVTTFFIEKEIDTGLVIEQEAIEIDANETAGELHDRLMHLGAKLTHQSVCKIANGEVKRIAQEDIFDGELKRAPKIFKPDCELDLEQAVQTIHNFIRGMSPYPTAWIKIKRINKDETKTVKLFKSEIINKESNTTNNFTSQEKKLYLNTKQGKLEILEIQLEGKKRLESKQFLTGFRPQEWEIIS